MNSPGQDPLEDDETFYTFNKKGYGYVIAVLLYEILVCLIYGILFGYSDLLEAQQNLGNMLLISILTILAIVGKNEFI